jgi:hypothetical protein
VAEGALRGKFTISPAKTHFALSAGAPVLGSRKIWGQDLLGRAILFRLFRKLLNDLSLSSVTFLSRVLFQRFGIRSQLIDRLQARGVVSFQAIDARTLSLHLQPCPLQVAIPAWTEEAE